MDPTDKFLDEFELVIAKHETSGPVRQLLKAAIRNTRALASSLDELDATGITLSSLLRSDVASLLSELEGLESVPALSPLLANARALLKLVDDGVIDGDAERLREAIGRAGAAAPTGEKRTRRRLHLAQPVSVTCGTCGSVIAGKRDGAVNWNGVTKVVRDHERNEHGGFSHVLRDAMSQARASFVAGSGSATAGRYELALTE